MHFSDDRPSVENGPGFTQQLALTMLAEQPHSLNRMFGRMTYFLDPLPGQGDLQVRGGLALG